LENRVGENGIEELKLSLICLSRIKSNSRASFLILIKSIIAETALIKVVNNVQCTAKC
jgi:hypothetical protein